MGMTDLEALLRPVSDDARCGPDLDAAGDPAYVELGVAAEWKEAKYVGEQEVAPAQAPDWGRLKETGAALLAVSKDLRIAKHYVAALAYTDGLPGFAAGVRLLRDLLDRYWEALHPVLESPDDDWRKNLVTELNAERGALGGLRAAALGAAGEGARLARPRHGGPRGGGGSHRGRDGAHRGAAARGDPRYRARGGQPQAGILPRGAGGPEGNPGRLPPAPAWRLSRISGGREAARPRAGAARRRARLRIRGRGAVAGGRRRRRRGR